MLPPPSEDNRVAELTRRVENLESALRAAFTTISGGRGLRVDGGGGVTIADGGQFRAEYPEELGGGLGVYVGDLFDTADGAYLGTGLLVQAPDGTDMATFRTDAHFGTTMHNIYDSAGRIILGNDAATGQGLARPWLDYTPYLTRYADWRTYTLAATDAWETVMAYSVVKQLPRLEVCLLASMDTAATTGELRVMVDGVQLGSTSSLAYAQGPNTFGPAQVAGAHMATLTVEVQVKRTTATGGVKLAHKYCRGRQSP